MRSKNMLSNSKLSKNIPQTPKNIFEEIFLQSTVSIKILDKEGWCVRINKKLSEIFGVLPEDIEGKKYNIFQDAEIKKHGIDKLLKKVYTEKSIEQWEVFFIIDNASKSQNIPIALPVTKWFSNTAYPVLNENGELENVIIQHQDITLQKENSLRLKASEESLQKIFNSSPVGLLLSNTEHEEIIMVNRAVEQLSGLPSKKIVGKSVAYFLADKADQKKYVTSIKQFGKVRNMEVALKKANNQLVTCYASGDVVEMNGESLFLTGIVNISELNQTQYALHQSEAKFMNLIEDLQVGLLVMDEHAKILMFNKEASNLLGYSSEQLLGKSAYDTDWKVIRDDGTFMPGNEFPVPIVVETYAFPSLCQIICESFIARVFKYYCSACRRNRNFSIFRCKRRLFYNGNYR
jgi:PAS domain S-box-containing protein